MTNNVNPTIPAKRYFTLDEVCALVQISPSQFARWQHENGTVVGYGGDRYTRSDVVKLLKLKETFAPYADQSDEDVLDSNGNPAISSQDLKLELENILNDLTQVVA